MKRTLCAVLAVLCMAGALAGCGSSSEDTVPVVSVGIITGHDTMVNSFAGKVVSGQTEKIENDNDRKIAETYVVEGDMVTEGEVLFEYDMEDMQLSLEKLQLELEQMQQSITDKESTIASLQSSMSSLSAADQASYTLQISSLQTDIRELEYNSTLKQTEIDTMESDMENVEVTASISGRVMSVKDLSDTGTDTTGTTDSSDPYIVIMDISAYRVEGQVNEMNIQNVEAGMPVLVRSRVDSTQVWNGVIESIDLDNPQSNSSDSLYGSTGDTDEYTSSSKYNFYVTLDNTDDLILGQHVYIEPDYGITDGLYLDESYIVFEEDGSAYVWAAGKNTLEKRNITLGEYNSETCSYEITEGLDYDDYIAFPSDDLHDGRKVEKYDEDLYGTGAVYTDMEYDYTEDAEAWPDGETDESYEEYDDGIYEDQSGVYDENDAGWNDSYASDTDMAEG